jgi:hypothetical protein
MEINEMSVSEVEKLLSTMKMSYKLENKGGIKLKADVVTAAPLTIRKASKIEARQRVSSTYASMVSRL